MSKSKRTLHCKDQKKQHNLSVELEVACPGRKQKTTKKNKQDIVGTPLNLKLSSKKKSERLQSQCIKYAQYPLANTTSATLL